MSGLNYKEIGSRIKERRQDLGITQEVIANKLDVNPSHISNIECGRSHPSLTALIQIANILQCSVDFFISGEYSYKKKTSLAKERSVNEQIQNKLEKCSPEKRKRILKMIDLM